MFINSNSPCFFNVTHRNADCQFSYITVHPPFFLGLESRPPYAPGFSDDQQNAQVDAAGRFHYARGLKISLEPHPDVPIVLRFGGKYQTENDSIYGNFFFASMFYKYGTLRYHSERQAQVAMSKYLLLYHHPDIDYLTEEYISGLCWKSINRWARTRVRSIGSGVVQNNFIGEQMISTISCSHDKQAAIKYTSDELLIKDLNDERRPHFNMLEILKRMEKKHFPKDGSVWFDQILEYVTQEHNNHVNEQNIAQMSKMLSENESNTQTGQAAEEERSRLKGLQSNNGNVEVHEEDQPDTLVDFMGSIGL
jgi:hypothetical protein